MQKWEYLRLGYAYDDFGPDVVAVSINKKNLGTESKTGLSSTETQFPDLDEYLSKLGN